MNNLPEPAAFEPAPVRKRHAQVVAHAWRLVGPFHRRAWQAWQSCASDVFILNPMADGKHLTFRLLPEAVSIALEEADVPKSLRAETRALIKALHGIDADPSSSPLLSSACLASGCGEEPIESWREVCPTGAFNCGCRRWFDPFGDEIGAAA